MNVEVVVAAAGHAVVGLVLRGGRDGDAGDVGITVGDRRIQGEAARQALHAGGQRDRDGGRRAVVHEIDRRDLDRKSVELGKGESVRVDLGGLSIITNKKYTKTERGR